MKPETRQNRLGKWLRDERGSVLMEAVIAIPLFLVLIGGTFWIGELILAKQKLVGSDRFAAWNAGNRHAGGTGGIRPALQQQLFPEHKVGSQNLNRIDFQN